ncbi:DMT family transporter [Microbulbifer sp. JMSA004]|uniref:DMT family transporter n=1 Tax=Microbulbifer sp. JMSA004 TaxID=3243370 RepID=UPI004039E8DF
MNILATILVVIAGMGLSVEAGLLGPLGMQVGHLWATLSIFGVGTALLWLISLFVPSAKYISWREVPKWQLSGGLLGPVYVVVLTLATPILGVAMTMIGILVGQTAKSFLIDSLGWFGVRKQPINLLRVCGATFLCLALYFTYLGAKL